MIDSFRALSSPPSLPLSLRLDYGDVLYLSPPPHPSLPYSTFFSPPYICRLPLCLFIHSSPGKGGCQSGPSASPSSNPPHIPSSLPTFIHLSFLSITVTLFSSLFSLSPSHSFLPVWDFFFLEKCICALLFFKAFLYLS